MESMRNDDRNDARTDRKWEDRAPATTTRWLVILGLLFFAAAIFGGGFAYQQSTATADLTAQNQALHSTIDQMRNQMGTMTMKLDQLSTAPPAQAPAAGTPGARRTTSGSSATQDRRMKQVQSQLAEQKKQLKETQDQLQAAKTDLEA